jgi:hypothetical protein
VAFDSSPPLLGILCRVGGYDIIEVNVELRRVAVTEGLTEDAVLSRLHEGGLVPPLFVHVPHGATRSTRLAEGTSEAEWERRVSGIFKRQVREEIEKRESSIEFKINFNIFIQQNPIAFFCSLQRRWASSSGTRTQTLSRAS